MTRHLEERLRDELVARTANLPQPAGLADVVIGRARRVRRHRLIATICSVILALAGSTTVYMQMVLDTDTQIMADAASELGVFSVLSEDGEIITGSGSSFYTELAVAQSAVEVHGGWVVSGLAQEDATDTTVRYVGYDGGTIDLAVGPEVRVHANERGDAVAVETVNATQVEAAVYTVTTDSKAISQGGFTVPEEAEVAGMAGQVVWMDYPVEDEYYPDLLRWSAAHGITEPEQAAVELWADAQIVSGLFDGRALVETPGEEADDMCLMTVEVVDDFYFDTDETCFSDLGLADVVVGPDGHQVMAYVQPAEPTEQDPGQWVSLELGGEQIGLNPTGFHELETRPFFTYQDIVFYEPDGDWYETSGEQLNIPPLAGQPIPIRHVP